MMPIDADIASIAGGRAFARVRREDLAILPLCLVMPFMYVPKVLEGDTQPWILLAALIALFGFRPGEFFRRSDLYLVVLALLCIVTFVFRSSDSMAIVRTIYIYSSFLVLWVVSNRENGDIFHFAVKFTIVVWFLVGLYQYLAVIYGWPVVFSGRYVEGRSGIPSLTSEASTYGSLSMVQMMYLIARKKPHDRPFILLAATSVLLSGSLLSMLLFIFPLMMLSTRFKFVAVAGFLVLFVIDRMINVGGLTARIASFGSPTEGLVNFLLDPSLNLRLGHIIFTLYDNFWSSLFLVSPISFMDQYNQFGYASGLFIDTGSNFILTWLGEAIYGAGIFGFILMVVLLRKAMQYEHGLGNKFMKLMFIIACWLNPISIANVFLVIYIQQKADT